ncbi:MAG: alkaline phosphatase D family protein [Burkholderiaceae bacterium]|nr:alkaline phosphatase family protein [Burkholderiaceae bacterium]MCZ8176605.1 alkaline phosphatase D family protein [Burkholderiaceae bacterium]
MNGPTRRRALLGGLAAGAGLAGCAQPALPALGAASPDRVRIGVASCCDQTKPQPLWDAVLAEAPEHLVFAGDNVYASRQPFDTAELRAAYAQQGRVDSFRRVRERIAHSAIWDDHDYGLNDGGADFPHKQASKDAFLDFWAVPATDERRAREGLHHAAWVRQGGRRVQLIVLDTRWWRSPLKPTDQRGARGKERYLPDPDPANTMLGDAQWAWLEQRLREPADGHVVVSSIQLLAEGHGFERWGNLPLERERFFRTVRASRARGVVLVSGDRHIGGLYHHPGPEAGRPLWELTSSGVTHPWTTADEPGPNRLGPLVREPHWGLVVFDFAAASLTLSLRGQANQVLHERTVPLASLQPA